MKKIILFIILVIFSTQIASADVDMGSAPTRVEFDIYKYVMRNFRSAYSGNTMKTMEGIKESAASRYNVDIEDIDIIFSKFTILELQLMKKDPSYQMGSLMSYDWGEIRNIIDEVGWDEIMEGASIKSLRGSIGSVLDSLPKTPQK